MHVCIELFQTIRKITWFCLALRGTQLLLDSVTKSLGLLRLPWSQHHFTTFSAVLFLVTARHLDRLGDIVINDASLVCLGGIQGFTWMNY